MDDTELAQVIDALNEKMNMLLSRQDELDKMYESGHDQTDERLHKLENVLYDQVLAPAKEAMDKYADDQAFNDFHSKYGSQLDAYNERLRPIEGDDFDLSRQAYNDYRDYEGDDKPDMDSYVAALVEQVGKQLEAIKAAMGVTDPNATVEVEKKGDEEAKVEVEGQEVQNAEEAEGHKDEAETAGEAAEEAGDTGKESDEEEVSIGDDEEIQDDPKEVEEYMKELEKLKQ